VDALSKGIITQSSSCRYGLKVGRCGYSGSFRRLGIAGGESGLKAGKISCEVSQRVFVAGKKSLDVSGKA